MNGDDVKTCPYHQKLDDKVEYHDKFLHKLDKKVDRFTWMSGLQLVTLVAILIKLFLMSLDMMAKG